MQIHRPNRAAAYRSCSLSVDESIVALRILQLNAGSFYEPDWDKRRHEIVAWIDRLDPDVICLQEIWQSSTVANSAAWLAEHARGDWHHAFGGVALPKKRSPDPTVEFGAAVLSRWPIDDEELHLLPLTSGLGKPSTRTWSVLRISTAKLNVFSVHLAAAPDEGPLRRSQVVSLDQLICSLDASEPVDTHAERRAGMPPVICGDFNAEPESDEIRFLCGFTSLQDHATFYQDAWRVAGADSPGYTQDWRRNELAADLNVHRKRIDYIFVGDAFRRVGDGGRVVSAKVVCDESLTGVLASDHFGVVADVVWPDQPARTAR